MYNLGIVWENFCHKGLQIKKGKRDKKYPVRRKGIRETSHAFEQKRISRDDIVRSSDRERKRERAKEW